MKASTKFRLIAVALAIVALCWTVPAKADTVSIGLQETGFNGNAITTVATGSGIAFFTGGYGNFTVNNVSGTGNPPLAGSDLLDSNSLNVASSAAGTINVFITSQGNTSDLGIDGFLSSFTSNLLSSGWSIEMKTYLSPTDALYGGTLLSDHTFTGIGTFVQNTSAATGAGPYSLTTEYIVSSNGSGSSGNSTIDISTPEPSTFLLLGVGLLGFGLLVRRNRLSAEQ